MPSIDKWAQVGCVELGGEMAEPLEALEAAVTDVTMKAGVNTALIHKVGLRTNLTTYGRF